MPERCRARLVLLRFDLAAFTGMNSSTTQTLEPAGASRARVVELFHEQHQNIIRHTDLLLSRLLVCQWLVGVAIAFWLSPLTWNGLSTEIHPHIWIALVLGSVVVSVPFILTRVQPGRTLTRHAVAIGQMLLSALLIHLTGGRIETHFHIFGSLAILAFYRDWKVLITAALVICTDHLLRGTLWPQSVYGVLAAPLGRSFEHAGWVAFEISILIISIRKSLDEMLLVAERQAKLEAFNESIEHSVADRTAELTREIIERRQTEEKLRMSQAQLAQAQQLARLGSWEWDLVHDKVSWSEETPRLYGHFPGDLGFTMEKTLERIHPDDLERVRQALDDALRNRRPFACDHRVVLPDGSERILQSRGEIDVDENGEPVRMLGIVQDITEAKNAETALRRSEEQLRQSQKMEAVGRLAGGVAHDFNNLLTVINGYGGISLLKMKAHDPLRKNIEEIQRAAERAGSLTRQLLAFSRKQVLQPQVLDLNEIVGGMEKLVRRLIGEDIELRTVLAPGLLKVKADPGQIEQVILNMAVNARDAMPHCGKLTITTQNVTFDQKTQYRKRALDSGEYVLLAISDTGVGMTDEVKAHLFEPFFTTKGVGKGTGLGLATCFGIVSQSGGDIRVVSAPGCGTTFKIYLPQTDEKPEKSSNHPDAAVLPSGKESVLVVEDDASVREFTASVLRERGYRVKEARSAVEALPLIEADPDLDLVVTDVIMPQMSGKELYDQIKARATAAKVLFISGYTDDALNDLGVMENELSFLEKPFSCARLAEKVRQVLDADAVVNVK
jgi:PAS domain S-box-containing protein